VAHETPTEDPDSRIPAIIETSANALGAAVGGSLGLIGPEAWMVGGPALGTAVGDVLRRVGLEVYDRVIFRRRRDRVGLTIGVMAHDARELAEAGEELRADDFFAPDPSGRSPADELGEGILLSAADAFQERKLRHLGALLPAAAVRENLSSADALWVARQVDGLTWRQLVALAMLSNPPISELTLRDVRQHEGQQRGASGAFRQEVDELARAGLLGIMNARGELTRAGRTWETVGTIWTADTGTWRLTPEGRLVTDLARLDTVPAPDRDEVIRELLA
jgi:hypothetical protein